MFGPTNFPRRRRRLNPGPLAQEASALTTRLPRFINPAVIQGWPLEFIQHIIDATLVLPSPAGPPGCCLLHFLHLLCLNVIIGTPNRSCIFKLRTNQCFVCNFLCMPRCKSQTAPKKTQCLSRFTRNFRNMLTPFQVGCKSAPAFVDVDSS